MIEKVGNQNIPLLLESLDGGLGKGQRPQTGSYFVAGFMEFDPRHAATQAHRVRNKNSKKRSSDKSSWFIF
jgi:hypothetical protein